MTFSPMPLHRGCFYHILLRAARQPIKVQASDGVDDQLGFHQADGAALLVHLRPVALDGLDAAALPVQIHHVLGRA